MRLPLSLRALVLATALALLALTACSDDGDAPPDRDPTTTVSLDVEGAPGPSSTDAGDESVPGGTLGAGDTDDVGGDASRELAIERFELPATVACTGAQATVTATYRTTGTSTVAFLVDQGPAAGATPPLSGTHDLAVPCDGGVHTVVLVAVGTAGQMLESRAVRTDPSG